MGEAKTEVLKLLPILNASVGAARIMEGWPKALRLELEGEESAFYIIIEAGKMRVAENFEKEPDLVMHGEAGEIAKFFRGDKDITHPLAHGQIRLSRGKSLELVVFLSRIIGAVHRKKMELSPSGGGGGR